MKRSMFVFSILLVICFCATALFADGDWKLVKDSDGTKVYTRPVAGSDMDEFKGVTVIDASLGVISEVLRDIPAQPQWMADCIESRVLKNFPVKDVLTEQTMNIYVVNKAPWPVKDRDMCLKIHGKETEMDKKMVVEIKSIGEALVPVTDKYVRITDLTGSYIVEVVGVNKTKVTYQLKMNPAGSVPASLANMTSKKIPFVSLQNLKKMVKKQKYIDGAKKYEGRKK